MPHITIPKLLERNKQYAANHVPQPFSKEHTISPTRTIVISCFDPRSTPEEFFQIGNRAREIVSIRNAGGHTRHIVHDIASFDTLLGIDDIIVVHHTDCGLTRVTNETIRDRLREYVEEGENEDKLKYDLEKFDFGAMTADTLAESCRDDVRFLKEHPWIKKDMNVVGFVYDIKTGLLHEV